MKLMFVVLRLFVAIVLALPVMAETASGGINSVSFIMKQWPYDGNAGASVRNASVRGVKLGMPLPEAVRVLESNGFSFVNGQQYQQIHYNSNGDRKVASRKAYYEIPANQRGAIIRSVTVHLTTAVPSNEVLKELPPFPATASQSRADPRLDRYKAKMDGMDDASRARMQSRLDRRNRGNDRLVKKEYVTGITFSQKSMSGMEQVDHDGLIEAARKNYGEPSYTINDNQSIAAAGAAFGKNGGLWYCDCALESRSAIENLLMKSSDDDRTMVFKDFIHPGNASNAYYIRAYKNIDDRVSALRIANAPYMMVGFRASAFTVDLQWPFLKAEREYRELWEKESAYKKKPKADVQF